MRKIVLLIVVLGYVSSKIMIHQEESKDQKQIKVDSTKFKKDLTKLAKTKEHVGWENEKLEAQLFKVNEKLEDKEEQINKLKKKVEEDQEKLKKLQEETKKQQDNLVANQKAQSAANTVKTNAAVELTRIAGETPVLQAADDSKKFKDLQTALKDGADRQLTQLNLDLQNTNKKINELNTKIQSLQKKITKDKSDIQKFEANRDTLKTQVKELEKKEKTLTEQSEKLTKESEETQKKYIEHLESETKQEVAKETKQKNEEKQLQTKLKEETKKIAQSLKENFQLKNQMKALSSNCQEKCDSILKQCTNNTLVDKCSQQLTEAERAVEKLSEGMTDDEKKSIFDIFFKDAKTASALYNCRYHPCNQH